MKKQNNILKYIIKTVYAMAFVVSLQACVDDDIVKSNYIEEGIPVEISMKYAAPKMTNISTRGLEEKDEIQVNDLYILIFNEEGDKRKVGSKLYTGDEIKNGEITLKTTSGNSRIYAIANVQNNQQQNLCSKLDTITRVSSLENAYIEMSLKNDFIDVDRTSPNLVMSGAFVGNIKNTPAGYCPITTDLNQNIAGNIALVRFDSHIKFRIRANKTKIKVFEPKTWQVFNVPMQSYLIERQKKNVGTEQNNYGKSTLYPNQNFTATTNENNESIYAFEFYQFENFKNSKKDSKGNTIPEFKDREKEEKDENGKNKGEFAYVEPYATYVEFTAYMELIQKDGNTLVADVKFRVLLGGKDSSSELSLNKENFNTWRNKKYTYDITINGVDDIATEVGIEDGKPVENRPGIEGDVIESGGEVRILDAHYNCFNITLTKGQVDKMSILVHTPFDRIEYKASDSEKNQRPTENRDYKWIKFKRIEVNPNSNSQPLATYTKSGVPSTDINDDKKNDRLDIYSLREDVIERAKNENKGDDDPLYYTVFVDEYYYNSAPCNKEEWGNDSKTYWTHFVNRDPRYIMLVYTPEESADGKSSWSNARYYIRQRSIQTYYSSTNLTANKTALGMEHVNEYESKDDKGYSTTKKTYDINNGFKNCYDLVNSKSWETYIDYSETKENRTNTVNMNSNASHAQCLSRNRDKNGDGVIDEDEIEWYLPTFNQISGMYLGATSLSSPLFTPPSTQPSNPNFHNDLNYHFATSDGDKIWAQEGCSNNGPGGTVSGKQVRCVRNLGLNANESKVSVPIRPYTRSGNNSSTHYVYDMSQMSPDNLRMSESNTLNYHDNFTSTRNKPYRKFELAKSFSTTAKTEEGGYSWNIFNAGKDLCQDYYEGSPNDATRGKGKWRTPNQRELLIIYNTGDGTHAEMRDGNYGMYSCTYWTYGKFTIASVIDGYRTFGFNAEYGHLYLDNSKDQGYKNYRSSKLRCVRDIN